MPRFRTEDKDFQWQENLDWFLRNIAKKGHIVGLPGISYIYECHLWFCWEISCRSLSFPVSSAEQKETNEILHTYLKAMNLSLKDLKRNSDTCSGCGQPIN